MADELNRLRNLIVSSFDEASKSRERFHASAQAQQAQQAQPAQPTHHERSAVSHRFAVLVTIQVCVCVFSSLYLRLTISRLCSVS